MKLKRNKNELPKSSGVYNVVFKSTFLEYSGVACFSEGKWRTACSGEEIDANEITHWCGHMTIKEIKNRSQRDLIKVGNLDE